MGKTRRCPSMVKLWNESSLVSWICNYQETAFFASIKNYILTIEFKKKNNWVCSVTFNGEELILNENCNDQYVSSKLRALGLVEGVFIGHQLARISRDLEIKLFESSV
jgi:hypothetical protein